MGLKQDHLVITRETLNISKYYGENLKRSDVQRVELGQSFPLLIMKVNGFDVGNVKVVILKLLKTKLLS